MYLILEIDYDRTIISQLPHPIEGGACKSSS
jgi:hypothetical protein